MNKSTNLCALVLILQAHTQYPNFTGTKSKNIPQDLLNIFLYSLGNDGQRSGVCACFAFPKKQRRKKKEKKKTKSDGFTLTIYPKSLVWTSL